MVPIYLVNREDAIRRGDLSLARAWTADLARVGYVEEETPPVPAGAVETTALVMPEAAVVPKRRGRPPGSKNKPKEPTA
jgi:hypothetical protein